MIKPDAVKAGHIGAILEIEDQVIAIGELKVVLARTSGEAVIALASIQGVIPLPTT